MMKINGLLYFYLVLIIVLGIITICFHHQNDYNYENFMDLFPNSKQINFFNKNDINFQTRYKYTNWRLKRQTGGSAFRIHNTKHSKHKELETKTENKTEKHNSDEPESDVNLRIILTETKMPFRGVLQLDMSNNPKFAKLNGSTTQYFHKIGNKIIFTEETVDNVDSEQQYPPDVNFAFIGPEGYHYFIRGEHYCRRQPSITQFGYDPPDFCPEGGTFLDLMGCNIFSYPPEVDKLCQKPIIDNLFVSSDRQLVHLFHGDKFWLLSDLPQTPRAKPNKCKLKDGFDPTKVWNGYNTKNGLIFTIESGPDKSKLVQFNKTKFTAWNIEGGDPIEYGEVVLTYAKVGSKKSTDEETSIEKSEKKGRKQHKIKYRESAFVELCNDPNITAADSNLNGSKILLFKKNKYYILNGLRNGSGKLVSYGLTTNLFKGFDLKGFESFITIKEGLLRGYAFEFMKEQLLMSWSHEPHYKKHFSRQRWNTLPTNTFWATYHNRKTSDPMMIGLADEDVWYFKTDGKLFKKIRGPIKYTETEDKLPSKVTAAFSMPNNYLYLFKENKYCVRDIIYDGMSPNCGKWIDTQIFLGCYRKRESRKSTLYSGIYEQKSIEEDIEAKKDLCSNLDISDADKMIDTENTVYFFRDKNYYIIDNFPINPTVIKSGITSEMWPNFQPSPDAVMFVKEGQYLRGNLFSFNGLHYSQWKPDRRPIANHKYWANPSPSKGYGAIMSFGTVENPVVIGFEGRWVYYYKSDDMNIEFVSKSLVDQSPQHWPTGITAAFMIDDNNAFLFRKNRFCVRPFNCTDLIFFCCKEWKNTKNLFNC